MPDGHLQGEANQQVIDATDCHMRLIAISVLLFLAAGAAPLQAQFLPERVDNEGIYDFLDELANNQVITLNSSVRPYSRFVIAEKLREAARRRGSMTMRQRHMLDMYMGAFSLYGHLGFPDNHRRAMLSNNISLLPPAYQFRDRRLTIQAKPLLEAHHHRNTHGEITHTHIGVQGSAVIGRSWSAWVSMQQISQSDEILTRPGFLNRNAGGAWAQEDELIEDRYFRLTDMRGGLYYSWDWGHVGFEKDHLAWGDHYHAPNILDVGPTNPTYPMLSLRLRTSERFSFHYHHGWLNSMEVRDTLVFDSHPDRYDYHNKFFATNIFTVMPVEYLHLSAGNSIVYSASNIYVTNLIPMMVFRVEEPTAGEIDSGHLNNTTFFVNVSSRQLPNTHLYASWFANSFKPSRLFDGDLLNFTSATMGGRLSNWPLPNTDLTVEFTRTLPKTYDHRTPIIPYAHEKFNMGHYMGPNARLLYLSLGTQPWAGLQLRLCYKDAQKGNYLPHEYGQMQDQETFMEDVTWRNTTWSLKASYLLHSNIGIYARLRLMDVRGFDVFGEPFNAQEFEEKYGPAFHHGETTTFNFGVFIR